MEGLSENGHKWRLFYFILNACQSSSVLEDTLNYPTDRMTPAVDINQSQSFTTQSRQNRSMNGVVNVEIAIGCPRASAH